MKKSTNYKISANHMKMCNICGEDTLIYTIDRNAPICDSCRPTKQKKVISQGEMVSLILNTTNKLKDLEEQIQLGTISQEVEE